MNTHTPPPNDDMPNDGTLTPEERELAALYHHLPHDEPPPALDAAILAQARQAAQPNRARYRRGAQRWVLGIGSAAALVMAAGVGWHVYSLNRGPASVTAAMSAANEGTPTSKPVADHVAASAKVEQASAPTQVASEMKASRAITADAPPPPPAAIAAKPALPRVVAKSAERRIAPPPPPLPPPPAIEQIHVVAAPPMLAPAPPPPPAAPAMPAPPIVDVQSLAPALVAAPAPAPPAAPAPPPAQALPAQATPAPTPALQAGVAPSASEAAASDSAATDIQHIRELLKTNQRAQALAALRDFTRAHPDYLLPDDLKALAESAQARH